MAMSIRPPIAILLMTFIWRLTYVTCHTINSSSDAKILVVGATGTTGLRAIQGLLDVGYKPSQLQIVTRNASKPKMKQLRDLGFELVQANLQHPRSLLNIGRGCSGCYIHATGGDTAEMDTTEISSAQNLCDSLHEDVECVVYNSAAGAEDHGVMRIQQKHDIECILAGRKCPCHVTSLRANIFIEELWKEYTRPQILQGRYPLPVRWWRKIYFTSVRDMGRLAGAICFANESKDQENSTTIRILNVAGDHMTGSQIARAFGKAQKSKCRYFNNRELTKMAKEGFPDLYEQIHFLQTSREKTNIASLKKEFPGLLTNFAGLLDETKWGDRERVFEDLSNPESLVFEQQ